MSWWKADGRVDLLVTQIPCTSSLEGSFSGVVGARGIPCFSIALPRRSRRWGEGGRRVEHEERSKGASRS